MVPQCKLLQEQAHWEGLVVVLHTTWELVLPELVLPEPRPNHQKEADCHRKIRLWLKKGLLR